MLRFVVPKNNSDDRADDNRGFTLIEILIVAIVAGILAAVAIPSFVGLMNQNKVDESIDILEAALRDVHKESMAKSINCELTINKSSTSSATSFQAVSFTMSGSTMTLAGTTGQCMNSVYTLDSNIDLLTNSTPNSQLKIRYSFKGSTSMDLNGTDNSAIFVVSDRSGGDRKCIIIPRGIGIIRTGIYRGAANTAIPDSCESNT
jgi:prepilin-type N-terminal cleavage/methylation domain-containing protein